MTSATLSPPNVDSAAAARARSFTPVQVWATIGAVLVVLELTTIVGWVSGSEFTAVKVGPDEPPHWMRLVLNVGQIAGVVVAIGVVYALLVRPWVRERRVTLNGLLVIGGILASFWDGLSSYPQHWFNYNSYLFNRGSVLSAVPGVLSPHSPGAGQAWPFFGIAAYAILVPGLGALGAGAMRRARRRFPHLGTPGLLVICVVTVMLFEILVEAMLLSPLGFYALGGGQWPIIGRGTYHAMPLIEVLHGAMFFTVPAALKSFLSDSDESLPERGAHAVQGTGRRIGMRALAVIGALHIGFLLTYHLPVMFWAENARTFPADVTDRSYFLGNTCGRKIDIACPGPKTPIFRPGTGHLDWEGRYVAP